MREDFLHFIWQFQLFNKKALTTTDGQELNILNPGTLNDQLAGPDFLNARIKSGEVEWNGNVEIHLSSSDWIKHKHQEDPNYNSVILHVVLNHDKNIQIQGEEVKTLELKGRIFFQYQQDYNQLLKSSKNIPCSDFVNPENGILLRSMLDRLVIQRLKRKSEEFGKILEEEKGDWEEAAFKWTCLHFGFKRNNDAFFELANILDWKTIRKVNSDLKATESLLFGAAGFLGRGKDEYLKELKEQFEFQTRKFELKLKVIDKARWNFFRLRPSNFPTLRIAQLAAFLQGKSSLLGSFLEMDPSNPDWDIFSSSVSLFWEQHVHFKDENNPEKGGGIGRKSRENLVINIVPSILVHYAEYSGQKDYLDKAIQILENTPAETNKLIKTWRELGFSMESGFDTQGFLELQKSYCNEKACLKCNLGISLVKDGLENYGLDN